MISGGWSPGCLYRQQGQRSTIDGELVRPGMVIVGSFDSGGLLRISHMTFLRRRGTGERIAGGLTANHFIATDLDIEIEHCRFADNTADHQTLGFGGGLAAVGEAGLLVRNNVFLLNHSATAGGAASLYCGAGVASFVNNTVVENTAVVGASNDIGGVRLAGTGCVWEVANNILWDNEGRDLSLHNEGTALRYNDIDDLGGVAPTTSTGNVSVDPKFVGVSQRLQRGSPLIDAGFNEAVRRIAGNVNGRRPAPGRRAWTSAPTNWTNCSPTISIRCSGRFERRPGRLRPQWDSDPLPARPA